MRHLLPIALVLEGRPRTEAAEACGMDRQTLRDWVHHLEPQTALIVVGLQQSLRDSIPTAAFKAVVERSRALAVAFERAAYRCCSSQRAPASGVGSRSRVPCQEW